MSTGELSEESLHGAPGPQPIRARSVLIRRKHIDSWFVSRAGMNLYRGCAHDCLYCDGRSETYRVDGDFARDLVYKENAPDILSRELDPRRRRKEFRSGYLFLGGGVSDSWQPAEKALNLTRRVLELFRVFPHPLLLLTKSDLILRDFDLLKELSEQSRITVAVSISTVDDKLARRLEPGASPPSRRLEIVRKAKAAGFGAGVMYLPVVPLLTDHPQMLDAGFKASANAGADFISCGSMTLKKGRQWDHFIAGIRRDYPDIPNSYSTVYGANRDPWGHPSSVYYEYFSSLLHDVAKHYGLPRRIPDWLFPDNISLSERAAVILGQMDSLLKERQLSSGYGRAARSLAELTVPLENREAWSKLRGMPGIGPSTERMVKEIIETGSSRVYRRVLVGTNPSG